MFEGDYTINGTHATYIKYLVNDVKAFERYIDVYMAGAVLGVLNDKRSKQVEVQTEPEYIQMLLTQSMLNAMNCLR